MQSFNGTRRYVLILCHHEGNVLVVEKHRPDWMAGRVNLIGGKVEPNETAQEATIRECFEETGYVPNKAILMGDIRDNDYLISCMRIEDYHFGPKPRAEETEKPFWCPLSKLNSLNIMPNLKIIIPLMLNNISYFSIFDEDRSLGNEKHTVRVTC